MGPLSVTNQGNRYIIIIRNHHERTAGVYPVSLCSPDILAYHLRLFMYQYGMVYEICTDQGVNFDRGVLEHLHQEHVFSSLSVSTHRPYQTTGSRLLYTMLYTMVTQYPLDWDIRTQIVMQAYQRTTCFTQAQIDNAINRLREESYNNL